MMSQEKRRYLIGNNFKEKTSGFEELFGKTIYESTLVLILTKMESPSPSSSIIKYRKNINKNKTK